MLIDGVNDFLTKVDLSAAVRAISTITLQQWVGLAVGPIVFVFGNRIREYFPSFGLGKKLLSARLEKKESLLGLFFFRFKYSILPLLGGLTLLTSQQFFGSFVLLSIGIPYTVYLIWNQERYRREIRFYDNCFKVNNCKYMYSEITKIEKSPESVRLMTNKGPVTMSSEDYRRIEPALQRHGYGDDAGPRRSLDLK